MASASSPVLKTLSVFLGLFFIFVGLIKVTPKINQELHRELKREFVRYSKVIPFVKMYQLKVPSKHLRQFVGGLEISCGAVLAFLPLRRMKQTANALLLVLMFYTLYTHCAVGDRFERLAPSLVFLFLLVCRLVVDYQIQCKQQQQQQQQKRAPLSSGGGSGSGDTSGKHIEAASSSVANQPAATTGAAKSTKTD